MPTLTLELTEEQAADLSRAVAGVAPAAPADRTAAALALLAERVRFLEAGDGGEGPTWEEFCAGIDAHRESERERFPLEQKGVTW